MDCFAMGYGHFSRLKLQADDVASAAALEAAVAATTRGRSKWSRSQSIYLASIVFERPKRSLARAIGVSEMAVRKTCQRVEEWREDVGVDRELDELEMRLMT
jgi:hypothetical protein